MVCARVIGNDATVAFAGSAGTFELNVMMPVMGQALLESLRLLSTSSRLLADRCVDGLQAGVALAPRAGVDDDRDQLEQRRDGVHFVAAAFVPR